MESVHRLRSGGCGSVVSGVGGIGRQPVKRRASLRIGVGLPVGGQLSEVVIEGAILLHHEDDVIDGIEARVLRRTAACSCRQSLAAA